MLLAYTLRQTTISPELHDAKDLDGAAEGAVCDAQPASTISAIPNTDSLVSLVTISPLPIVIRYIPYANAEYRPLDNTAYRSSCNATHNLNE